MPKLNDARTYTCRIDLLMRRKIMHTGVTGIPLFTSGQKSYYHSFYKTHIKEKCELLIVLVEILIFSIVDSSRIHSLQ